MDKVGELSKQQKEDEKLLLAKAVDKIKMAEGRNRFQNTDFLNLAEQASVMKLLETRNCDIYEMWGGFPQAERKMLIIFPQNIATENYKFKIYNQIMTVLRITLPKELWGTYEHKTYLGALIKTGVIREKIGDIIVKNNGADIIISADMIKFLDMNLSSLTRFQKSKIEFLKLEELEYVEQKKEILKITVASMRLDCIVAELARCSRLESAELIKAERVFVNYKEELVGSKQIKENDTITIRGKGRFKISKIIGNTRKGKISIEIEK